MPRRSRFTVTCHAPGEPVSLVVILAYSAEGARRHYEDRGQTVVRVQSGDYRMKALPTGGGFRIDQEAVEEARGLLGLKMPVKIRLNGRVGPTNGNYRLRGRQHHIMVKSYLPAEKATEALWHELCHAMQAERSGGTIQAWIEYHDTQRGYSYWDRPMEREARALATDMRDIPLCH